VSGRSGWTQQLADLAADVGTEPRRRSRRDRPRRDQRPADRPQAAAPPPSRHRPADRPTRKPAGPVKGAFCSCCGLTDQLRLVAVVPRRDPDAPVEHITLCPMCTQRYDRAWRWQWRPVEHREAA
jgi:hypothetical protein